MLLFFVTFAVGIVVVVWMLRLVLRATAKERR
jgi:hypothetical protein